MRQADPAVPGPKISDDIQLTYQLEDLSFAQRGSYGLGVFVGFAGGLFGGFDLHVLSPGGIFVRDVIETIPTGQAPINDLATMRTSDTEVAFTASGAFPRDIAPQIAEGPPGLCRTREGYINFFLSGYIFVIRDHPLRGTGGFFVRFNRHLQIFNNQTNETSGMSILYDELLRDAGQPPPGPG